MGQQRVLLGLVEAMDLIDEQDRARAVQGKVLLGPGDDGADLDNTAHHRRKSHEPGADGLCQQARQAGLAGSRRTPQQQ